MEPRDLLFGGEDHFAATAYSAVIRSCHMWARAILAVTSLSTLFAQEVLSPIEILNKMSEKYASANTYELVSSSTSELASQSSLTPALPTKMHVFIKGTDNLRMDVELTVPENGSRQSLSIRVIGADVWLHFLTMNAYVKDKTSSASIAVPAGATPGVGTYADLGNALLGRFLKPFRDGETARLPQEQSITINGREIMCYVIEIQSGPVRATWWIDKSSYLVVRQLLEQTTARGHAVSDTIFEITKLDEPMSDDVFVFVPPQGAIRLPSLKN